jgi:hypothetical protein
MNQDFDIIIVGGAAGFFYRINIVEKNPKLLHFRTRRREVLQKSTHFWWWS